MARITLDRISDIDITTIPHERTLQTREEGALHSLIRDRYEEAGYGLLPKNAEEAAARGQKHFNGLTSSFPSIRTYKSEDEVVVAADIMPTRYLVGQAARDVVAQKQLSFEQAQHISPQMANVSLLVPVKIDGEYGLLGQIKGNTLGGGQLHAALAAGNINAKYLSSTNPMVAALQEETSEEVGMNLSSLDSTAFVFMIDEAETGQVNFASVARGADITNILNAYDASVRKKLGNQEKLEVAALATLPIAALAFVPLEKGNGLANTRLYVPTANGLEERVDTVVVRPYTQAAVEFMRAPESRTYLLEKAGL